MLRKLLCLSNHCLVHTVLSMKIVRCINNEALIIKILFGMVFRDRIRPVQTNYRYNILLISGILARGKGDFVRQEQAQNHLKSLKDRLILSYKR